MAKPTASTKPTPAKAGSSAAANAVKAVDGFAVAKNLTMASLKLEVEAPRVFKILTPMSTSTQKQKMVDDGKGGKKAEREPATICEAVDAISGEVGILICSAVIKSSLEENYPDDAYVGKFFQVTKHEKKQGKNYYPYSIHEVTKA